MTLLILWPGAGVVQQQPPPVLPPAIGSPAGGGPKMHKRYLELDDERIMELLAALLDD